MEAILDYYNEADEKEQRRIAKDKRRADKLQQIQERKREGIKRVEEWIHNHSEVPQEKPIKPPKSVKPKKQRRVYDPTLPPQYKNYLSRANKKNIPFELSIAQFFSITNQACNYCGQPISNGIDRINSKKGYTMDNTNPCCTQCNMMKYIYSEEQFKNKVRAIYNHLQLH